MVRGPPTCSGSNAKAGASRLAADARPNRASARTKVYATVYRGWGTPHETATRKVVVLATGKEMHAIAEIEID